MGHAPPPVMMINVQPGQTNTALLQVAASVAATLGAQVVGVAAWQPTPVDWTGGDYQPSFVPVQERDQADAAVAEAEAEFRRSFPGTHAVWHSAISYALPSTTLVNQVRGANLVVTGTPPGHGAGGEHTVAGDLVMQAGCPVLVVPWATADPVLDRVMLAWTDREETRRATSAALPLLRRAAHVLLVEVVGGDELEAARDRLKGVAQWLTEHGVEAKILTAASKGNDAEQLGALARGDGIRLVVAGAYGHGRLREWVFGGVTRALLVQDRHCAFVSH